MYFSLLVLCLIVAGSYSHSDQCIIVGFIRKIKAMRCLVCVLFYNKIVCKDDVFLAFKPNENLKFCTMMYRMAMLNGIDCLNNQTLGYCIARTHFDWLGLKCCI